MIYLDLLIGFLKVGCFSFGGAYAAIPLIREVVLSYGWVSEEMLTDMIAVSESTPGPIMVNMATYVGSSQAGFWGALIASAAVVLPSFVIILLITIFFTNFKDNEIVERIFKGIRPCVVAMILVPSIRLIMRNTVSWKTIWIPFLTAIAIWWFKVSPILIIVIVCTAAILIEMYSYNKLKKQ